MGRFLLIAFAEILTIYLQNGFDERIGGIPVSPSNDASVFRDDRRESIFAIQTDESGRQRFRQRNAEVRSATIDH